MTKFLTNRSKKIAKNEPAEKIKIMRNNNSDMDNHILVDHSEITFLARKSVKKPTPAANPAIVVTDNTLFLTLTFLY